MTGMNRFLLTLVVLVAWTCTSCHQVGPLATILTATPGTPLDASGNSPSRTEIELSPGAVSTRRTLPPMPSTSAKPGDRVVWRNAPVLRPAPVGVGVFLADVESRLPADMGTRYRDRSRVTWCHETTHGVHAALRNQHGRPAFYPGGGKFTLVEAPPLTLTDVAEAVPQHLRGMRYQTYLVAQRKDWNGDPLYVWDEWVAYDNGTTTGIEEGGRNAQGASDDAVACLELSTYALAVAAAARRKGVPVSESFREFLAWELRRSLGLYTKAVAMPAFAWHDRRLERRWRDGDPFVTEELRALYGEGLTVRDLLP